MLSYLFYYRKQGIKGDIKVNNIKLSDAKFQKLVAYIPQYEVLRSNIKVSEYMRMVANLKLGFTVSDAFKTEKVNQILLFQLSHVNLFCLGFPFNRSQLSHFFVYLFHSTNNLCFNLF